MPWQTCHERGDGFSSFSFSLSSLGSVSSLVLHSHWRCWIASLSLFYTTSTIQNIHCLDAVIQQCCISRRRVYKQSLGILYPETRDAVRLLGDGVHSVPTCSSCRQITRVLFTCVCRSALSLSLSFLAQYRSFWLPCGGGGSCYDCRHREGCSPADGETTYACRTRTVTNGTRTNINNKVSVCYYAVGAIKPQKCTR